MMWGMYQQFALSTSQALLAFERDDDTLRLSVREANHNHKVPKAVSALPVEYAPRFTQAGLPTRVVRDSTRQNLAYGHADLSCTTIQLLIRFTRLVRLLTRIYQAVQQGALTLVAAISRKENSSRRGEPDIFTRRRSPVRIRLIPGFFTGSLKKNCGVFWRLQVGLNITQKKEGRFRLCRADR